MAKSAWNYTAPRFGVLDACCIGRSDDDTDNPTLVASRLVTSGLLTSKLVTSGLE
jgi:hypothetical protein